MPFLQRCSNIQRLGREEGQTSCLYFCWGCKMSQSFLHSLFYSYLLRLVLFSLAVPLEVDACKCLSAGLHKRV